MNSTKRNQAKGFVRLYSRLVNKIREKLLKNGHQFRRVLIIQKLSRKVKELGKSEFSYGK